MYEIVLGTNKIEQTYFAFTIVLIALVLFAYSYQYASPSSIKNIQSRSLWFDWRFIFPCIIYTLVLSFRFDYAWDWAQYKNTFEAIQRETIAYRQDTEVGYLLVNKVLVSLGLNYYSIFVLEGVVYLFSIYYLFSKNRAYLLFALPLVYIAYWNHCLNLSRQFFAMSLLLISYKWLLDGKNKQYFVLSILSGFIHSSAFVWIIPFFLFRNVKLYVGKITFLLIIFICAFIQVYLYEIILNQISFAIPYLTNKELYQDGGVLADKFARESLNLMQLIVRLFFMVGYVLLTYNLFGVKKKGCKMQNYVYIGLYSIIPYLLAGTNEILSRSIYYVDIYYRIGWGVLIYTVLKNKGEYNPIYVLIVVLMIIYSLYGFYSTISFSIFTNHQYIIYKI